MRIQSKLVVAVAATLLFLNAAAPGQAGDASKAVAKDRAHIVRAQTLPPLEGDHLKVTLVEVNYGPGEASPAHSHPCAVIGYVAKGEIRTQVKGEAETVYKAGESFYEPPNGVHLVSANASATKPARLIACLICDREGPLSTDVGTDSSKGGTR